MRDGEIPQFVMFIIRVMSIVYIRTLFKNALATEKARGDIDVNAIIQFALKTLFHPSLRC